MSDFNLESGEHTMLAVRQHWLVFLGGLIPFALVAWLPLFIVDFVSGNEFLSTWLSTMISLENPWTRFILGIWWLFVWMGAFGAFTRYFLDRWIITNKRVIYIEQHGFWRREVSYLLMSHIQDVHTDIHGFFQTLFGFGTINIDSSGPHDDMVMRSVDQPRKIRDLIIKEIAEIHHPNP